MRMMAGWGRRIGRGVEGKKVGKEEGQGGRRVGES